MSDSLYTAPRAQHLNLSYAANIAREADRLESLAMLAAMARGYRDACERFEAIGDEFAYWQDDARVSIDQFARENM